MAGCVRPLDFTGAEQHLNGGVKRKNASGLFLTGDFAGPGGHGKLAPQEIRSFQTILRRCIDWIGGVDEDIAEAGVISEALAREVLPA
jgi:hypothetical protein